MLTAVRDCLVTGHEPLIPSVDLPDPDDRHVLAAAIRARAQVIVTNNLKDFPTHALRQWIGDVLVSLERCGLVQSVAALRAL